MFKIKDLAGLSKPLKRLVEAIAEGTGGVSRPLLAWANAKAKAYEIRTIAQAVADSQKLLGPVKYNDGKVSIESVADAIPLELPDASLEERTRARTSFLDAKRQHNTERITQQAAEELRNETEVPPEKPDSDFLSRLFRIAEDVTTESMQMLWGKVLAGEIKRPGSFSLRSMEALRNMSQAEAEVFVRAARVALSGEGREFIPSDYTPTACPLEPFGVDFDDMTALREAGMIELQVLSVIYEGSAPDQIGQITCGSTFIMIEPREASAKVTLAATRFTSVGRELAQLIEKTPASPDYIRWLARVVADRGGVVKTSEVVAWNSDGTFEAPEPEEVAVEP